MYILCGVESFSTDMGGRSGGKGTNDRPSYVYNSFGNEFQYVVMFRVYGCSGKQHSIVRIVDYFVTV
jgi:hypothetical protein